MLAIAFSVCGAVAGLGALLFTVRRDRREVGDRRQQIRANDQQEEEKLSDFVVRQTQEVITGIRASNDELRRSAEELLRRLETVTHERDRLLVDRDDLRGRVRELEDEVSGLKARADVDRSTIVGLSAEVAELRAGTGGT